MQAGGSRPGFDFVAGAGAGLLHGALYCAPEPGRRALTGIKVCAAPWEALWSAGGGAALGTRGALRHEIPPAPPNPKAPSTLRFAGALQRIADQTLSARQFFDHLFLSDSSDLLRSISGAQKMQKHLQIETERLQRSWAHHEQEMLRDYLVADVEDPRINVQSILTRHFLIEALAGRRFAELQKREIEFATVMNWLLKLCKQSAVPEDFAAIHFALQHNADSAEGVEIPTFVTRAFQALKDSEEVEIPNYFQAAVTVAQNPGVFPSTTSSSANSPGTIPAARLGIFALSKDAREETHFINTFQMLWKEKLVAAGLGKISVIEPACGSANDFRFFEAFGIAPALDYFGFDLSVKNVANAKAMFPSARFETGNVFEITAADKSFDYCIAHDLFEHLSLEGLEAAAAEVCRVTRLGACLGFFSVYEGDDHIVREVDEYHWNTLGLHKLCRLFSSRGFGVQVIHVDTFLQWRFGCSETHNKNAYTIVLRA